MKPEQVFDMTIKDLAHGNVAERASAIALRWGQIDGSHHKAWVIDQMLRVLAGSEYSNLVDIYEQDGYEWDTGIAP